MWLSICRGVTGDIEITFSPLLCVRSYLEVPIQFQLVADKSNSVHGVCAQYKSSSDVKPSELSINHNAWAKLSFRADSATPYSSALLISADIPMVGLNLFPLFLTISQGQGHPGA